MKRPLWRNNLHINMMILTVPFLITILLTSCQLTTPQPSKTMPTSTASPLVISPTKTTTPAAEVVKITPTSTLANTSTPTRSLPTFTSTPLPCPLFPLDMDLPDPDIPENYVGRHYDMHNLPQGLEDQGGYIIRDKNNKHELAIQELAWQEDRILYWLEKLVCRVKKDDGVGQAYFEIVDAITSPPLSGDEIGEWTCFQNDEEVDYVNALGYFDEETPVVTIGEYTGWLSTKIVFAFRIDFETEKLVILDPENLVCLKDRGP